MFYRNFLIIVIFLFTSNCTTSNLKNKSPDIDFENSFTNKGFTLVYTDELYSDKVVTTKVEERSLLILQRNLKKDLSILRALKVDYVFVPNYKDIFSFSPKHSLFVDKFSKQLCGKFRKSHFLGVLNIINRLLEIIKPNYMYLGQKDFQQLYLIKQHVIKKKINTKIIICKTIREKNSFALSSRNRNLTLKEKELASKIYHLLYKEKLFLKKNNLNKFNHYKIGQKILKKGIDKIDYIKLINISNPNKKINRSNFNIFIAYYISNIRLIDNL